MTQPLSALYAPPGMVIRHAIPGDAARIEQLYRQLVNNCDVCVLPERIQALENDLNTGLFVCEVDGVVNGTVLVSLCQDVMFKQQPFAVLENWVVDEAMRGNGAGALLARHVEQFCVARDCSKIMLLNAVVRTEAHRFFEKIGFGGDNKRGFVKYRRDFCINAL